MKQQSLPLILDNTTETPVLRDTLVAITALPGCMFWRNNTGLARTMDGRWIRFGLVGSGDIIGSCRGRAVAIETKRPKGGRYSQEQRDFATAWTLAGGLYVPATHADQALAALALIP